MAIPCTDDGVIIADGAIRLDLPPATACGNGNGVVPLQHNTTDGLFTAPTALLAGYSNWNEVRTAISGQTMTVLGDSLSDDGPDIVIPANDTCDMTMVVTLDLHYQAVFSLTNVSAGDTINVAFGNQIPDLEEGITVGGGALADLAAKNYVYGDSQPNGPLFNRDHTYTRTLNYTVAPGTASRTLRQRIEPFIVNGHQGATVTIDRTVYRGSMTAVLYANA